MNETERRKSQWDFETVRNCKGQFASKGERGRCRSRAYLSWSDMIQRCTNPHNKRWADYGGRGIKVCDRWLSSAQFCLDMGERPLGMSLDRRDNDGNYEPSNCYWATREQQQNNRRTNRRITYQNETLTCTQWAARLGINESTLSHRIRRGWTTERALETI